MANRAAVNRAAVWSATAARDLLRRRLAAQWIAPQGPGAGAAAITAVAARMLAMQAQDYGQAVWALGVRSAGSTRADVEAALDTGRVVRSWPMRGTLHVSTPDSLRLMLSITAARTIRSILPRYRALGLDDDVLARTRQLAATELRGGGRASRDEFFALLAGEGIDPGGQRGTHVIMRLALEGLVCWGPTRDGRQQLVLLDEWAPPGDGAPRIQSGGDDPLRTDAGRDDLVRDDPRRADDLGDFVLRYVAGHGPATLKDFCWWSKVTVAEAKLGLERARDRLVLQTVGGVELWTTADQAPNSARTPTPVPAPSPAFQALPGFDEYLLGYQDRAPALAPEFFERIVPGANGIFLPMLVAHGRVLGTWRRRITATAVTASLVPFEPLSATARTGFERAMRGYASFQGLPLVLEEHPHA